MFSLCCKEKKWHKKFLQKYVINLKKNLNSHKDLSATVKLKIIVFNE